MHIIFQPFRSFIHVIYLQNCIIHLQMDHGDQLYTLVVLMSFDVGKSRISEFLTMRDLTKSGTKEELAALCFFGMQVELAFGAITRWCFEGQQEMLQHFERVWNYRPPSDLFWLAWWTWSWYAVWPPNFLTDITQFLLAHGDVALTNDMLKDYKVGKAYEYFSSGWLQEGYFLKAKSNNNNLCILRTKCSPSQTLDDDPHNV